MWSQDVDTVLSSDFIVGKKRNVTSIPKIIGVGVCILLRNDDNSPGEVVIRSHEIRIIGERFQNMST